MERAGGVVVGVDVGHAEELSCAEVEDLRRALAPVDGEGERVFAPGSVKVPARVTGEPSSTKHGDSVTVPSVGETLSTCSLAESVSLPPSSSVIETEIECRCRSGRGRVVVEVLVGDAERRRPAGSVGTLGAPSPQLTVSVNVSSVPGSVIEPGQRRDAVLVDGAGRRDADRTGATLLTVMRSSSSPSRSRRRRR